MQKDDRIKSAGTEADSQPKAENIGEASNDTKPHVVGSPSLSDEFDVYSSLSSKAKEVVPQVEQLLNGLSYKDAETMMFAILSKIRSCSLIAV